MQIAINQLKEIDPLVEYVKSEKMRNVECILMHKIMITTLIHGTIATTHST